MSSGLKDRNSCHKVTNIYTDKIYYETNKFFCHTIKDCPKIEINWERWGWIWGSQLPSPGLPWGWTYSGDNTSLKVLRMRVGNRVVRVWGRAVRYFYFLNLKQ